MSVRRVWSRYTQYHVLKKQIRFDLGSMGSISGEARRPLAPQAYNVRITMAHGPYVPIAIPGLDFRCRLASCNWLSSGFTGNWHSVVTCHLVEHAQCRHQASKGPMRICHLEFFHFSSRSSRLRFIGHRKQQDDLI